MAMSKPHKLLCVVLLLCICWVYFYHSRRKSSLRQWDVQHPAATRHSAIVSSPDGKNGTAKPTHELKLDDIFFTVKTSAKFHKDRVALILKTWWNKAKNQTYFFTDADDEELSAKTGGHTINTKCGSLHDWGHLCCKMGKEYDTYYDSGKKWWCHFDDDNYVNVDLLVELLREYDWKSDTYLGRASWTHPLERRYLGKPVKFWFATGGAGVCITRHLSEKMSKWTRNGAFEKTCRDLNQPDDCTIGFIINNLLGLNFTERKEFNSHLQDLGKLPADELTSQVVLSYHSNPSNYIHHAPSPLLLSEKDDPTRILSLHCLLYPTTEWCPRTKTLGES